MKNIESSLQRYQVGRFYIKNSEVLPLTFKILQRPNQLYFLYYKISCTKNRI